MLRLLEDVSGFDWDAGNLGKCTKHGVSQDDVEFVLRGDLQVFPDVSHSVSETRFLAIGRDPTGRHTLVAFTLRERGGMRLIRPISARYMHAKEVRHYEAQDTPPPETPGADV